MGPREEALWSAQLRAEALFAATLDQGLVRPGILESELSEQIHTLAKTSFGLRRHWHRRIVRSGPNTVLPYAADPPDRLIDADDVVYLDLGPVFGEWEADVGRTYALGDDPRKHKLVADIRDAFRLGQALFEGEPDLTAGELYDYVAALAVERGWNFGNTTAGHLVDHFPHEPNPDRRFTIRSGNTTSLREPRDDGAVRHWILEIHFVDRDGGYGGFLEELLTIRGPR